MKYPLILLLVLGSVFAATLMEFDIDTENACDGKDEITVVTVTDADDGDPVEDAYIKVEDISPWKQKTSGTADSDGEFEFAGCGDTWNVSASYGGYETKTVTITLGSCGSCDNPAPPTPPPVQNTTNTTSGTTTTTTTTPTTNASSGNTGTSGSTTTTTTTTTSNPPSYPADPSDADDDNETQDDEEGATKKKPLPCCASSAIIIGLAGLLALKARA